MIMDYLKLIKTQEAKATYACKNAKKKLHRTDAAIWCNKMCRLINLTKPYIVKTEHFTSVLWITIFCNISIYPPVVTHLPEGLERQEWP
jgi:hypothetical protein